MTVCEPWPVQMTVEELHGIFQFTDDLFEDENKKERVLTIDKNYTPRKIFPGWFKHEASANASGQDDEQTAVRLLIPDLYRRGQYEQVVELTTECIKYFQVSKSTGNVAGVLRDLSETKVCALMKLNRPHEALTLLPLMDGVEEPGRLIVKSRVYFETGKYQECIEECRKFLALRPGDYLIATRLAECMIILGQANEEVTNLLNYAQRTVSSYYSDPCTAEFLKPKYEKDLRTIQKLWNMIK